MPLGKIAGGGLAKFAVTGQMINWPTPQPVITLFTENFESPVVVGYDQQPPVPTNWLPANNGFGSNLHGLDNKSSGDWASSQPSNNQAYAFKYTNSGLCTAIGVIGTININNVKYTLTFDAGYDKGVSGGTPSGAYKVFLCALPPGFARQDWTTYGTSFAPYALVNSSGTVADDNELHTITATYITNPITNAAWSGYDLAVGLAGATASSVIDNIKVESLQL